MSRLYGPTGGMTCTGAWSLAAASNEQQGEQGFQRHVSGSPAGAIRVLGVGFFCLVTLGADISVMRGVNGEGRDDRNCFRVRVQGCWSCTVQCGACALITG